MHDDYPGGVPQGSTEGAQIRLRHFDKPISIRDLLHSTLDRLFDAMIAKKESMGVVAVTNMDPGPSEWAGHTVVLALDLDPTSHEYEGLNEGPDGQ